uniref:Uncharacterized protein n=1 Tax=Arundo donax TaxID=35708 RepID=A0A0A8ZJW1_ARUDO
MSVKTENAELVTILACISLCRLNLLA